MLLTALFLACFPVLIKSDECAERCERLKQRSLERVGYDDERVESLFERQRPLESLKDICWRLYDNIDCMKKCKRSEKHAAFTKIIRNKCKNVLYDMEPTLKCISKHQSFLKMKCKSYIDEASKLRAEQDINQTPSRDVCQFLHFNTICLENDVNNYCANGKAIFRRLKFRDYFLSFLLPNDDDLFDDEDLDSCRIYDFVKDDELKQKEEEELRREQAKRLRIDDDYDYEEELTTVINGIEDEETTTIAHFDTSTISSQKAESVTPDTKEFTEIIDEMIDSSNMATQIQTTAEPEDEYFDEEIEEEYDDNSTHPTINVVAIEDRKSTYEIETTTQKDPSTFPLRLTPPLAEITTTTGETTAETKKKKVFSDDSMEFTPPNFFYSSSRFDTTTRSNYVVDNIDKSESTEPMEIDTTTLFGIEESSEEEKEQKTTKMEDRNPWINSGEVIVKPILGFDEKDVDAEEERERKHREKLRELQNNQNDGNLDSPEEISRTQDSSTTSPSLTSFNETIVAVALLGIVFCNFHYSFAYLFLHICSTIHL
ncbi:unnamed protein product [Caenorhabditis angaria]|uniref:Chondroitin proteoglycan 4 domain-containing protein n=1 Tax=Caenorhabditis angaria TaxID=860376 RepID=A0A9P1I3T3_9PELO|nr:unnamed protein product [Caenorhabditis angaria]